MPPVSPAKTESTTVELKDKEDPPLKTSTVITEHHQKIIEKEMSKEAIGLDSAVQYTVPPEMFAKKVAGQGQNVPAIAKKLKSLAPDKKEGEYDQAGQTRYHYTITGETPDGRTEKKSIVIKKGSVGKGPQDLISLLTFQKQHLWTRE